jgi:hypothetical protein
MGISDGFGLLNSVLTDTIIFNISWILSIIFVFLTLIIITRDVNKWKTLAFPVTILWHIVGITPSFILYIITGLLFIIDALSMQGIGNMLQVVISKIKPKIKPLQTMRPYNINITNKTQQTGKKK